MALTIRVARGYTFGASEAVTIAALNALGLPVVVIDGSVGTSDLDPGAISATVTQPGPHFYAVGAGTANVLTANPSPALTAHADGALVFVKALLTNTGDATLNVNALGASTIRRGAASGALHPGDILAGGIYAFQWNGTFWHLLNPSSPVQRTAVNNASTADHLILTSTLALPALYTGAVLQFTVPLDVLADVDLNPDGLGAKSIRKTGDLPLAANDLRGGQVVVLQYDASLNAAAGGWALKSVTAAGPIIQQVRTQWNSELTTTVHRVRDDNVILQSEMDLVAAAETVITPKSAASKLVIDVQLSCWGPSPSGPSWAILALFEGTDAADEALSVTFEYVNSAYATEGSGRMTMRFVMDSPGITALTFRLGLATVDGAHHLYVNAAGTTSQNWGGKIYSNVTVTEYAP